MVKKQTKKFKEKTSKKTKEPKQPEVSKVSEKEAEPKTTTTTGEAKTFPVFEGLQVIEVLSEIVIGEGVKFNRCKMSNGTTMDVPMELF